MKTTPPPHNHLIARSIIAISCMMLSAFCLIACIKPASASGGIELEFQTDAEGLLQSMAKYKDAAFEAAILKARENEKTGEAAFVDLFFMFLSEDNDPDLRFAKYFMSMDLGISAISTNEEITNKVSELVKQSQNRLMNLMTMRLERAGISSPRLYVNEYSGAIHITLPGASAADSARVVALLSKPAALEFRETVSFSEADSVFTLIGKVITELEGKSTGIKPSADTATASKADPFLQRFTRDSHISRELPLMGYAKISDTAAINRWLRLPEVKTVIPPYLEFLWEAKPHDTNDPSVGLLAIRKLPDGNSLLRGKDIHSAIVTGNPDKAAAPGEIRNVIAEVETGRTPQYAVLIRLTSEGSRSWTSITERNTGKCIALVADDAVYGYPRVRETIPTGRALICGNFSKEEAAYMVAMLESGILPLKYHL